MSSSLEYLIALSFFGASRYFVDPRWGAGFLEGHLKNVPAFVRPFVRPSSTRVDWLARTFWEDVTTGYLRPSVTITKM